MVPDLQLMFVARFDYFEDVTVLVGPQERRFIVHKNIICRSSAFFRLACTGEWKEVRDRTVKLHERDPVSFEVYLGWLYTGEVDLRTEDDGYPGTADERYGVKISPDECGELMLYLVNAYSLGDLFQDARYCNTVIDDIVRLAEGSGLLPHLALLSGKVPQTSKLARLFVDYWVTDAKQTNL